MELARTIRELRAGCEALRRRFGAIALVPTMGALHDGHLALVRQAVASGAAVVTSIFVNPLQFGASEDLSRYPRDEAGDLATLEAGRLPSRCTPDDATTIDVAGPAELWEGQARPGHFRGVATVCARLFGQVRPDRAYFGEKDWQQLQVVRRMVADLHLPLDIVGVATVREPDGLALSSRNRFLTAADRAVAPQLSAVLQATAHELATGVQATGPLNSACRALVQAGFRVDYFALVDGPTLQLLATIRRPARLIAAARLGSVRLIDNVAI